MPTSTSAAAKKRGQYNFAEGSQKAKTSKAKPANKASARNNSNNNSNNKASARPAIDLGLASISRSTTNAARQTASTVNDNIERQSKALRGAFANASGNAKQLSERISNIGRELTSNLSQAATKASKTTNSSLELGRQNAAALSESCTTAAKAWRKASAELAQNANANFANNVEAAREAFSCRTIADLFALANTQAKRNLEAAVQQATKLSEVLAETAALALEPINEQASKNSKKLAELIA